MKLPDLTHLFFSSRHHDFASSTFVLTSALKKSFEMIVLAMSQKWPVLLHGPAGSGKTALINTLAKETGNQGKCRLVVQGLLI